MPSTPLSLSTTQRNGLTVPSRQSTLTLPNGMKVSHHTYTPETEFVFREIFEERMYLRNGVTLKDGDLVVDVGAHIGLFSMFCQTQYKGVQTYSFEPVPSTHDALEMNLNAHGRSNGGSFKLFRHGISDSSRNVEFTTYPRAPGNSTMFPDEKKGDLAGFEREFIEHPWDYGKLFAIMCLVFFPFRKLIVRLAMKFLFKPVHVRAHVRTLSEVMSEENISRVDLLKVDCEGAELDVLRGIKKEHWPRVRQIVMELGDVNGRLDATLALLHEHGFRVETWQAPFMKRLGGYLVYATRA